MIERKTVLAAYACIADGSQNGKERDQLQSLGTGNTLGDNRKRILLCIHRPTYGCSCVW